MCCDAVGSTHAVPNEGMPIYRTPFERGNLYIKFDVIFPPNQFIQPSQVKVRQSSKYVPFIGPLQCPRCCLLMLKGNFIPWELN